MKTTVLITRYGGLGDLIMILPTLQGLKRQYPKAKFVLRTYKDYVGYVDHLFDQTILDDNQYLKYPFESGWKEIGNATEFAETGQRVLHINLQGVIESRSDVHGVIAFRQEAGVTGKGVEVHLPLPFEVNRQNVTVVQLRDDKDGRGLTKNDLPQCLQQRDDVIWLDSLLTPKDYLRTIAQAQTFIGPDSSGLHLASALGVPEIVGLYSPEFPPAIRAYPNVKAFTLKYEFQKELSVMYAEKSATCPICTESAVEKREIYWMCPSCDAWFQHPMPVKKFEAQEEKGADGRSNGHNQSEADLEASARLASCFAHNWISRVRTEGPAKTLDIGCKYPYFAYTLQKLGMESYGIDGMDFDADQTPILSRYSEELGVPMLMVDFEKVTPWQILNNTDSKKRFDAISMVHVFEHMYDPYAALKTIHELLNPEGYFLIRVPSHEVPGMEWHMSERHYSIHPFYYSEQAMKTLMKTSGLFKIVETYPMGAGTRDYILKPV
jgi:2-polyprenyl-3-methyl-5-hydroxy-6-metoxy-1,4-benzoquinol methylase